ncbi:MAG: hypothetical protein Q7T69_02640 [Rhodoferax sp.]|nr:hypothetical protein [Rhodoferax sp.]
MQQKELAKLLGISPAMVSKLKKMNMPIDSLEKAQRWRRRHLEPGRVKGVRFDPTQPAEQINATPAATAKPKASVENVESAALALDASLMENDAAWAKLMVQQFRQLLRQLSDDAEPRLSLRVWLALVDWIIPPDLPVCRATNTTELLTPREFGLRWHYQLPPWPLLSHHTFNHACDWDDISINGWPDDPEEDAQEEA